MVGAGGGWACWAESNEIGLGWGARIRLGWMDGWMTCLRQALLCLPGAELAAVEVAVVVVVVVVARSV